MAKAFSEGEAPSIEVITETSQAWKMLLDYESQQADQARQQTLHLKQIARTATLFFWLLVLGVGFGFLVLAVVVL